MVHIVALAAAIAQWPGDEFRKKKLYESGLGLYEYAAVPWGYKAAGTFGWLDFQ